MDVNTKEPIEYSGIQIIIIIHSPDMIKLIEVTTKQSEQEFLRLPDRLYKDDPNWIKPLNKDIRDIFDPAKNKHFRHGEAIRWILKDGDGITIARLAAFYDKKICYTFDQPTGSIGFFECIDSKEAAFLLFDTAKEWLSNRGMEAMDGPVNFGDRDKWWGLLVEGFYPPNYCVPYNLHYYKKLFEEYGFQNYYNQYTFHRYVFDGDLDEHMKATAARIADNPRYSIKHIAKGQAERYAEEFRHVYNNAWKRYSGVKEISVVHARSLLRSMKPILDERLVWFAYYDNEPVGFFIMIPQMNQVFRHLNGSFNLCAKLKFLWYFKIRKVCTTALGLIFGITVEHQRKGIEGAMVYSFREVALRKNFPYKELELNWIGDFNPTMMRIAEMVGCKIRKTHVTYRYLFDRSKSFVRAKKVS